MFALYRSPNELIHCNPTFSPHSIHFIGCRRVHFKYWRIRVTHVGSTGSLFLTPEIFRPSNSLLRNSARKQFTAKFWHELDLLLSSCSFVNGKAFSVFTFSRPLSLTGLQCSYYLDYIIELHRSVVIFILVRVLFTLQDTNPVCSTEWNEWKSLRYGGHTKSNLVCIRAV